MNAREWEGKRRNEKFIIIMSTIEEEEEKSFKASERI
jgi:hypothetical protein